MILELWAYPTYQMLLERHAEGKSYSYVPQ